MGQITLRGIDPKVEKKIRMLAKKSGKSLNRVVLDILYQNSASDKKNKNDWLPLEILHLAVSSRQYAIKVDIVRNCVPASFKG